jgi:hypothetical protein
MKYLAILLLTASGFLSGCVTQLNSTIAPGTKLSEVKKVYVVHLPQDQRRIDNLIADRLNLLGIQATSGEKANTPKEVDAVLTYQDKWMWDITMYMIELNVQLRNPSTDMTFASGHTLRTSLARKSPPDLIDEVLTEIFKKK